MVSTQLKNISQIGSSPQVGVKKKTYLKPPPSINYLNNDIIIESFFRHVLLGAGRRWDMTWALDIVDIMQHVGPGFRKLNNTTGTTATVL